MKSICEFDHSHIKPLSYGSIWNIPFDVNFCHSHKLKGHSWRLFQIRISNFFVFEKLRQINEWVYNSLRSCRGHVTSDWTGYGWRNWTTHPSSDLTPPIKLLNRNFWWIYTIPLMNRRGFEIKIIWDLNSCNPGDFSPQKKSEGKNRMGLKVPSLLLTIFVAKKL